MIGDPDPPGYWRGVPDVLDPSTETDMEFSFVLSHDQAKFDKLVEAKLNDPAPWTPLGGMGVLKEPTQYTYWLGFTRAKVEK